MDLIDHLRVIWRRRWLVLGLSLAVAGLVFLRSSTLADVYRAEAQLTVTSADSTATTDQLDFLVGTYTGLATTRPVLSDALRRSETGIGPDEAQRRIAVSSSSAGGLLKVSATGPSREAARALAEGEASALVAAVEAQQEAARKASLGPIDAQILALEAQLPDDGSKPLVDSITRTEYLALLARRVDVASASSNRLALVQPAIAEGSPISPTPSRDAVLALLVALVVNAELMVVRQSISGRFGADDEEAITAATGLPVLAAVPDGDGLAGLEAFRRLRTSLAFTTDDHAMRMLAIVGAEVGGGKTHIAKGLASHTARLDVPVVLVDADLHEPDLHHRFGIERCPGVGDLTGDVDPGPFAVRIANEPGLRLIPAGTELEDPSARLSTDLVKYLGLLGDAELIVVDTPAASVYAESLAVAAQCDAALVVVEAGRSRRRDVTRLVEQLRQFGARPIGVVLNRVDAPVRPPSAVAP